MDVHQAIESLLTTADTVVQRYLSDFPTDQWSMRPHPDCNDLNWQFGHAVLSESQMIDGGPSSQLTFGKDAARIYQKTQTGPVGSERLEPEQLWIWYAEVRKHSLDLLRELSSRDLDRPMPDSISSYCPTLGDAYLAVGAHWMMHTGQWAVLRRIANLPIVI